MAFHVLDKKIPVPSILWVRFSFLIGTSCKHTLPETNIAPENRPLEKEIPIGNHHFWGAMLVLGSVFPKSMMI